MISHENTMHTKTGEQVRTLFCKLRLSSNDTLHLICLLNASNSPLVFPKEEVLIFNDRDSKEYKFLIGNGFLLPIGSETAMQDGSGEEVTLDEFIKLYNEC